MKKLMTVGLLTLAVLAFAGVQVQAATNAVQAHAYVAAGLGVTLDKNLQVSGCANQLWVLRAGEDFGAFAVGGILQGTLVNENCNESAAASTCRYIGAELTIKPWTVAGITPYVSAAFGANYGCGSKTWTAPSLGAGLIVNLAGSVSVYAGVRETYPEWTAQGRQGMAETGVVLRF